MCWSVVCGMFVIYGYMCGCNVGVVCCVCGMYGRKVWCVLDMCYVGVCMVSDVCVSYVCDVWVHAWV